MKQTSDPAAPPAPEVARGVFSDALPVAERFAELLASEGIQRGLIGPREVPRLWDRHLLNCAMVTEPVAEGSTVCDIGSGAGLPGLVMAIRRSDLRVTLVEPLLRRTTFLNEVVADLGLSQVTVLRGRAEEQHGRATFDVVTARAVAPLDRLCGWALPLVRTGGEFLAMKGSAAEAEVDTARAVINRNGGVFREILDVGEGVVSPQVRLVRIERR